MEAGKGSEARPYPETAAAGAGAGGQMSVAYFLGRDSAENKINRRECRDLTATC